MGIRESLLNTITSVGSSDFVRIVTSAGASSKATLQNVIKSFETGLGAKTSLTTSDYIRVVGSDNNLYKQSVGDAADMMAERYNEIFGSGTTNNANDAKIGVWYRVYTSGENIPAQGVLYTYGAASSKWQQVYTGTEVYTRAYANNAWSAWVKLPTRTEINTLNNLSMHSIQGNVSNFDSIPDGVSCGYLLNATGVPEGWYLCLKNTVASNSKELYLLGTGGKAIYTSQYRNSAWSTPSAIKTKILGQSVSVAPNGSATVTLPSVTGSFLCAWRGQNAVWRGLALITKTSTSDGVVTIITSNMGTVTESGNTLTFTNQHGSSSQTYYIEVNRIGD